MCCRVRLNKRNERHWNASSEWLVWFLWLWLGMLGIPETDSTRPRHWYARLHCHCGLVVSAPAWDRTGREFDSWQCRIYISHVHWAYDYLGPFGVLWVHMAWHKNCVKKKLQHARHLKMCLDPKLLLFTILNHFYYIKCSVENEGLIPKFLATEIRTTVGPNSTQDGVAPGPVW